MYSGKADWDIIRDVKKAVDVPVLANGDIWEAQDVIRILNYTGADFAMIARGAFGNPWIFEQAKALLDGDEVPSLPPIGKRVDVAIQQFEIATKHKSEKSACLQARKHFAWYLRGVPHSGRYKNLISKAETLDDLRNIAKEIKEKYPLLSEKQIDT